jgi:hypothetical protein
MFLNLHTDVISMPKLVSNISHITFDTHDEVTGTITESNKRLKDVYTIIQSMDSLNTNRNNSV